jgi:hypothetical protein
MRMSGPGLGRREVERHVLVAVGENRYQSGPLSPGEYDILLRYRFVQGIRGSGRDLSSVDPIAVLRVSIDPDREDAVIDLGEVSLVAYQDVSGQISARSSRGELLELGAAGEALRVQVMQQVGVLRTAEIGGNGSVLFRRVPSGTYRLVIQGVPSGWYVASATGGGRDVLNHGLVVGGQAGPVTISLSAGALDVQGVARREDGAPAADVRVLLIPPVHLRGEFTRYPTAVTDQTGAWIIRDVAPGEYRAIAVDPQGRQEGTTSFYNYWEAPEFLRRAEGLGDLIRLASGSAPPLQLSLEIVPTGDW